jgi:aspartate--ammonia ligase
MLASKRADLAGPGIGNYEDVEQVLPDDYHALLSPRDTQRAIYAVKAYIEEHLATELNLTMVQVPLIVEAESGVNDMLDRDGSRTPIQFHISNDHDQHPVDAQIVQAATKWKRMALREFGFGPGEGLLTDMRAVRKDYFLDHDHSAYVDQWDWERVITESERNLDYLKATVRKIWKVITGAERYVLGLFPALRDPRYPELPEEIRFVHAEDILDSYPDLPRKQRETLLVQKYPAVFIIGIGWPLRDGFPHEMRAADYDDWATETRTPTGEVRHGLNGDILVWNPVTCRRHELMSGGIRVVPDTLRQQLAMSGQLEFLRYAYHRAILMGEIPLSIGGGIGQSRTQMLLLRKAHLGEVSVTVWPKVLKEIGARKNIFVLE